MERACRVCDDTIAVVAPRSGPARRCWNSSRSWSTRCGCSVARAFVHDPRLHQLRGGQELCRGEPQRAHRRGRRRDVRLRRRRRRVLLGLRPDGLRRRAGSGGTRCLRPRSRRTGSRPRGARPGVLASEVNRACREPIEEGGHGPNFKHRMGHGIGLDVHERPFVSEEDDAPRDRHDVHRRAVDPRRRSLRRPDRGRGGLRARWWTEAEPLPPDLIVNVRAGRPPKCDRPAPTCRLAARGRRTSIE